MKRLRVAAVTIAVAAALTMTGCDDENSRLAELAQRELEHRAAETKQLAEMHSKVQEERIELGNGRDRLEADRRQLATQRHRDPLIATAITGAIGLLVCALPLFVCWRLLRAPEQQEIEQAVGEILISDFVAEKPLMLPRSQSVRSIESNGKATG